MSQIDLKIGPKIKAFRRQLGIQANKLSDRLGISPSYLNLIENGKRKIDGDLLLKVCEELKIELKEEKERLMQIYFLSFARNLELSFQILQVSQI